MQLEMLSQVQKLLGDTSVTQVEQVQSLWSGYGAIIRYHSQTNNKNYIVKHINPPTDNHSHPRGWNTDASHQRKLKSYLVETAFYQHYSAQTDSHCKTPQLIASDCVGDNQLLVMEDLDSLDFAVRKDEGCWDTVKIGIRWLAWFHARFMWNDAKNLWPIGSYWHLATRQDELNKMPAGKLRQHASAIDHKLNSAQYQTLIHGDAKLANMCFHLNGNDVAAVDFQYVGRGVGVKDLAYFAGSAFYQEQLFYHHNEILEYYLHQLKQALTHYKSSVNFALLEKEYRLLYPLAWADFDRFLSGWNPQSWKVNEYMKEMTQQALKQF